jgi:hypothetical protein
MASRNSTAPFSGGKSAPRSTSDTWGGNARIKPAIYKRRDICTKGSHVITLHLKKQLIHVSAHDQTGVNGEANPAGSAAAGGNPFLLNTYEGATAPGNSFMAEQAQTSSVNGWVIGAVASAVSGLALLANTLRKTDAAVSVPV